MSQKAETSPGEMPNRPQISISTHTGLFVSGESILIDNYFEKHRHYKICQFKFFDFYDAISILIGFLLFYKDLYYARYEKEMLSFKFITWM